MASGVWWLAAISTIFFLGIYLPVMNVERSRLEEVIGDEYSRYVGTCRCLFRELTPARSVGPPV